MAFFRTPCYERLDWVATRNAVLESEALGYDSVFVADHVFLGREGAIFEGSKGWRVPSQYSGREGNNFITRSVDSIIPNLEQYITQTFKSKF